MPRYEYDFMSMDAVDLSQFAENLARYGDRGFRLVSTIETKKEPPEADPDRGREPVVLFIFEREANDADPAGD